MQEVRGIVSMRNGNRKSQFYTFQAAKEVNMIGSLLLSQATQFWHTGIVAE